MACIIPRRIINPHYKKIAKENDEDVFNYEGREDFFIDVNCGRCINCIKSYMTMWRTRLMHEFEYMTKEDRQNSWFITLTFKDDVLHNKDFDLYKCKYRFIDRIRKKYGSTPRYWLVTEYGERTQRLHLHGLIFNCNFDIWKLSELWTYGFVQYRHLDDIAIKYVTSYITKGNEDVIVKPAFRQRVFCSPGIGLNYCKDVVNINFHRKDGLFPILFNSSNMPIAMPRYYRQKLFTPDELEDMSLKYFMMLSDDVIPDGPYRIGNFSYNDYTLYKHKAESFRPIYNKLYMSYKDDCSQLKDIECTNFKI